MESECIEIRRHLKETKKILGNREDLKNRIDGMRVMMLRVSESLVQETWMNDLINSYRSFISSIRTLTIPGITGKIDEIEKETISIIVLSLAIPAHVFESIYNQSLSCYQTREPLSVILPKFLTIYLSKTRFNSNNVSAIDFDSIIQDVFQKFQIPYNTFVKSTARQIFREEHTYNLSNLELFLQLYFGNSKNFRFYVKIAKIVNEIPFNLEYDTPFNFTYNITLTSFSRLYTGTNKGKNGVIDEGWKIDLGSVGVFKENSRTDRLVIFGKHPQADVVFPPDDKNIDQVSLILIHASDNVYAIDASRKTNCGLKLTNDREYILSRESLYCFAKTQVFLVKDMIDLKQDGTIPRESDSTETYSYFDNEEVTNGALMLEGVEGIYKGQPFRLSTFVRGSSEQQLNNIVGTGGDGISPQLFVPRDSGLSKRHADFVFNQQNKSWTIKDINSTNGTYLLLKNNGEYSNKRKSQPIPVFEEISQYSSRCILISRYIFFLMIS